MIIRFALRRNLIYPLQLLLLSELRNIEVSLIKNYLEYNNSLIFTSLMFLGEFLTGLILYIYIEKFSLNNRTSLLEKINTLGYIAKRKLEIDNKTKIFLLIIVSSFFDFTEFLISAGIHKFITLSGSFESRIRGIVTLNCGLFCKFLLRLNIFKHQIFSLVIIVFCILIVIITEFIFQEFSIFLSLAQFIMIIFLIFILLIILSLQGVVEKYLFEINQLSPFYLLMYEGIFGFIFSSIYYPFNNPFGELDIYKNEKTTSEFSILIFCFILYIILSGLKNAFRLQTIKLYSPMNSTFMQYILNPFYIIYYFASGNDFLFKGKRNVAFFIINLLMSLILTFCGCVYNEFIILFCCGLERDTHFQVTKRSEIEGDIGDIDRILDENDEDNKNINNESLDYIIEMKEM